MTVDLADELLPPTTTASPSSGASQFHTTVTVHSSADQQAASLSDCSDESQSGDSSTTTSQSVVHESSDCVEATSSSSATSSAAAKGGASLDSTPLSTTAQLFAGAESAVAESRPAPSRRPTSRPQGQSTVTVPSTHARSNNELSHHAVMGALFRRHSKAEVAAVARRQQQEAVARAANSNNQVSGGNASPMSVSVPNLTTTMEQTVSLLESFAAVARRNLGNNTNNLVAAVTGANNNPCSSLVRLALSSNSPGDH